VDIWGRDGERTRVIRGGGVGRRVIGRGVIGGRVRRRGIVMDRGLLLRLLAAR
jgi:hypothetical protein